MTVEFDADGLLTAARSLPISELARLIGKLEEIKIIAVNRLSRDGMESGPARDRLLDPREAAQKLGTTLDWLYRHASTLPFTVRLGDKQLRFSELEIERWIRQRAGK